MQFRSFHNVVLLLFLLVGCHLHHGAVHRIEEGDTLVQIAHLYGITLQEILAANHIPNPNELKPGQKIFIPKANRVTNQVNLENLEEIVEKGESPTPVSPSPLEAAPPPVAAIPRPPSPKREVTRPGSTTTDLIWPAAGNVIWPFGVRRNKMHNGIDIKTDVGAPIRASAEGEVAYRGRGVAGYGDIVILKHPGRLFTVYAYLGSIQVNKGAAVRKGDLIARSQADPSSSFFHFEIRRGKTALDPTKILPRRSK